MLEPDRPSYPCDSCGLRARVLMVNGLTEWPESLTEDKWLCILIHCLACGEQIVDITPDSSDS